MKRWLRHARAMAALVAPSLRLIPWWHLLAGAVLAVLPVWLARRSPEMSVTGTVEVLRFSMLPLALSLAFTLVDPSLASTADAPLPVMARRAVRLGLVVPAVVAAWCVLLAIADTAARASVLPAWSLSLELLALLAVTLAVAVAVGRRRTGHEGGLAAGPTTLVLVFVLHSLVPSRWAFYVPYGGTVGPATTATTWFAAHQRWAALAVVAGLAFLWSSRDPGRRGFRGSGRDRRPGSGSEGADAAVNRAAASTRQPVKTSRPERS